MERPNANMAKQIADVAAALEKKRSGLVPKSVTVVQSEGTLVVTLHGVLSPAEQALAKTPAGAAKVQEYHRQLYATDSEELRSEIARITGVKLREAAADVETNTGTVVAVFTTGTIVQVYLLANPIPEDRWNAGGTNGP